MTSVEEDKDVKPKGEAEQGSLGILFIAAALALAVFLTVVGLIAFAAMSR
jgi:hypothetical protein